jgi:hypothetical protein
VRRGGILTVKNWLLRQQLGVALLALSEARLLRESVAKAIGIRRGLAERSAASNIGNSSIRQRWSCSTLRFLKGSRRLGNPCDQFVCVRGRFAGSFTQERNVIVLANVRSVRLHSNHDAAE